MIELDGGFIFGASMLCEGKAIGTSSATDLMLVRDMLSKRDYHINAFREARKVGTSIGKRKLVEVQSRVKTQMMRLVRQWGSGKLDESEFRKATTRTMKTAWRDMFLAGLRSSGVPGKGSGGGSLSVALDPRDDKWLRSASAHEMRYLNGFIDAVISESWKMPLERRVQMYVDSLSGFYDSARVIGMPENTVVHWVGNLDANTCASCKFLIENSPYTKYTLPCAPRSGMSLCLTNCRCRVLLRRVDYNEMMQVEEGQGYTRDGFIAKLRKIKRGG